MHCTMNSCSLRQRCVPGWRHTDAGLLGRGALVPLMALAVVGARGVHTVAIQAGIGDTLIRVWGTERRGPFTHCA